MGTTGMGRDRCDGVGDRRDRSSRGGTGAAAARRRTPGPGGQPVGGCGPDRGRLRQWRRPGRRAERRGHRRALRGRYRRNRPDRAGLRGPGRSGRFSATTPDLPVHCRCRSDPGGLLPRQICRRALPRGVRSALHCAAADPIPRADRRLAGDARPTTDRCGTAGNLVPVDLRRDRRDAAGGARAVGCQRSRRGHRRPRSARPSRAGGAVPGRDRPRSTPGRDPAARPHRPRPGVGRQPHPGHALPGPGFADYLRSR